MTCRDWIKALSLLGGGLFASIASTVSAQELRFPVDCTLGKDCFIQQYVDRDPGIRARDFTCGPLSYNNHNGTDIRLTNNEAMRQGVNVLSASAGTVVAIRDGLPDSIKKHPATTRFPCGNGVLVKRSDGWELQYCHLKKDSVVVKKGDDVEPGTILGQIGLSGRTQFPHLHITVRDQAGRTIDPFDARQAGQSCRLPERDTLWSRQTEVRYQPGGVLQAGFSDAVPGHGFVRDGTAAAAKLTVDAPALVFWAEFFGLQRDDVIALELMDPRGQTVVQDRYRMRKTRAIEYRAAGRRAQGPWSAGTYTGHAQLIRGGSVIATLKATVPVE